MIVPAFCGLVRATTEKAADPMNYYDASKWPENRRFGTYRPRIGCKFTASGKVSTARNGAGTPRGLHRPPYISAPWSDRGSGSLSGLRVRLAQSRGQAVVDPTEEILDFAGAGFRNREFRRRNSAETPVGRTHPFATVTFAAEDVLGHSVQAHKPDKPVRFVSGAATATFSPLIGTGGDMERSLQQGLRNFILRGQPDHLAGGKASADQVEHVGDRLAATKDLKGIEPEIPDEIGKLFGFSLTGHHTALHGIVTSSVSWVKS